MRFMKFGSVAFFKRLIVAGFALMVVLPVVLAVVFGILYSGEKSAAADLAAQNLALEAQLATPDTPDTHASFTLRTSQPSAWRAKKVSSLRFSARSARTLPCSCAICSIALLPVKSCAPARVRSRVDLSSKRRRADSAGRLRWILKSTFVPFSAEMSPSSSTTCGAMPVYGGKLYVRSIFSTRGRSITLIDPVRDELPLTPMQKLDRAALRADVSTRTR